MGDRRGQYVEELPIFDGDTRSASKWLEEFSTVAFKLSLSTDRTLAEAEKRCTNVAKTWFIENKNRIRNWQEFVSEFKSRFMRPEAPEADAAYELSRLRQDHETGFCDHLIEVQRLCHIANPEVSESEQILWFLKSVRSDYRPTLVLAELDSVNSLRDKCAHIDSIEAFHNREPKKPSTPENIEESRPPSVTFKTKVPSAARQPNVPLPNVMPEGGEGTAGRRGTRPYCTFCRRQGHWTQNCFYRTDDRS